MMEMDYETGFWFMWCTTIILGVFFICVMCLDFYLENKYMNKYCVDTCRRGNVDVGGLHSTEV